MVTEGFDLAKQKTLQVLEELKLTQEVTRDVLINVARSSLMTKIHHEQAAHFTEVGDSAYGGRGFGGDRFVSRTGVGDMGVFSTSLLRRCHSVFGRVFRDLQTFLFRSTHATRLPLPFYLLSSVLCPVLTSLGPFQSHFPTGMLYHIPGRVGRGNLSI